MNFRKIALIISMIWITTATSIPAAAGSNVVVVPLGSGGDLKSIRLSDVLSKRFYFFNNTVVRDFFTVDDTWAYVITAIHVEPDRAFGSGAPGIANMRFCRRSLNSSNFTCPFSWGVPNDEITQFDFGTGFLYQDNGTYRIDFTSFGDPIFDGFSVSFMGYRVKK